jgi:inward rectifier potassium channel
MSNKINNNAKSDSNTGFGTNATNYGGRFITKNGNANVRKTGISFLESISWFHTMLTIPRWKFMIIVVLFYFLVNFIFASLYFWVGVEHLNGVTAKTKLDQFGQAFFFSIQTFTTVGYGHISPSGFMTSFIAAVEALFGLLSFAIATGLFYGRFSKPQAHLLLSENAIIAPFNGATALMIRISPFKNTNLTDAEAKITLGMTVDEHGKQVNKFYQLELEYAQVNSLTLSWTLVHPITEKSPLFGLKKEDYAKLDGELLVFIKMYDDMYSSSVVKRSSYTFNEVIYGAKFNLMYSKSADDSKTILHIDSLNSFNRVEI